MESEVSFYNRADTRECHLVINELLHIEVNVGASWLVTRFNSHVMF